MLLPLSKASRHLYSFLTSTSYFFYGNFSEVSNRYRLYYVQTYVPSLYQRRSISTVNTLSNLKSQRRLICLGDFLCRTSVKSCVRNRKNRDGIEITVFFNKIILIQSYFRNFNFFAISILGGLITSEHPRPCIKIQVNK